MGDQIVLAGDHKQLPPYHSEEIDSSESFFPSLFEQILERFGDGVKATLRKQYRMHEKIANFSNREFYDDLLLHGEENRTATLDDLKPLVGLHSDSPEEEAGNSYINQKEAEIVTAQVQKALNADVEPEDVGVITPYSKQKQPVLNELRNELGSEISDNVKVQTIDSFQGGQREVIIVTFTRSNSNSNIGFLSFPNEGPRRLNVALTRAKKRLVLIGNWDTLSSVQTGESDSETCANLYSRLENYIEQYGVMYGR